MFTLLKNTNLYAPKSLGKKDILIVGDKIIAIEDNLDAYINDKTTIWDAKGKIVTPGLIDQHIHVIGAGGKQGFSSMTPEVQLSELIACGTTTINSLLGTDGTVRDIRTLYGKVKALEQEGISTSMFCGYYGVDTPTITDSFEEAFKLAVKTRLPLSSLKVSESTENAKVGRISSVVHEKKN